MMMLVMKHFIYLLNYYDEEDAKVYGINAEHDAIFLLFVVFFRMIV